MIRVFKHIKRFSDNTEYVVLVNDDWRGTIGKDKIFHPLPQSIFNSIPLSKALEFTDKGLWEEVNLLELQEYWELFKTL